MGSVLEHFTLIKDWLHRQVSLQVTDSFLWCPVLFAAGVGLYFSLPEEPAWPLYGLLIFILGIRLVFTDHGRVAQRYVLWGGLLVVLGLSVAHIRAVTVAEPVLARDDGYAFLRGTVSAVEWQSDARLSARMVLRDVSFEDDDGHGYPRNVRLSVRAKNPLPAYDAGDVVEGGASLHTPSDPVFPGGFDFRRNLFFKGIGAIGFFYGAPAIVSQSEDKLWTGAFSSVRNAVNLRVFDGLDGSSTGVVSALLTGQKGAIDNIDIDAMRFSGLAHMLAISGLHVGLFSATFFFFVRLTLVMVPGVALRWPVKKVAAVVAFAAACGYMMLAGATLPTQRAVIMVGIVFMAVLLDRTAISMRLVAVAALVVLLFAPESLLSISFQLSFAAVIALIAVYDALRGFFRAQASQAGVLRRCALYVGGVLLTSLIAAVVTAPFALYYFQTVAVYGVLANILAMPVLTFVVMPSAVLALALMPFGLEEGALSVMAWGVDQILWVAHFVSSLEFSQLNLPAMPLASLLWFVAGGVFLCLWRGALRWLGVIGVLLALWFYSLSPRPDVIIAADHDIWAYIFAADKSGGTFGERSSRVLSDKGQDLYVSTLMRAKFERENWMRMVGAAKSDVQHWRASGEEMACDAYACRLMIRGVAVSFVYAKEVLPTECAWAQVLVTRRAVRHYQCAADYIVDYWAVRNGGAHSIYIRGADDVVVRQALSPDKSRLWRLGVE